MIRLWFANTHFAIPFFLFFLVSLSPVCAQAVNLQDQIVKDQLGAAASGAGAGQATDPRIVLASVIQVFLTILGSLFLVLIIMSGYWLVTARGDEAKVEKGKSTIRSAIVGLAIVVLAYAITYFATTRIFASNQPAGRPADSSGPTLRFSDGFQEN